MYKQINLAVNCGFPKEKKNNWAKISFTKLQHFTGKQPAAASCSFVSARWGKSHLLLYPFYLHWLLFFQPRLPFVQIGLSSIVTATVLKWRVACWLKETPVLPLVPVVHGSIQHQVSGCSATASARMADCSWIETGCIMWDPQDWNPRTRWRNWLQVQTCILRKSKKPKYRLNFSKPAEKKQTVGGKRLEENRWLKNKGRHIIDNLATGLKTRIYNKWLLLRNRKQARQRVGELEWRQAVTQWQGWKEVVENSHGLLYRMSWHPEGGVDSTVALTTRGQ